MPATTLWPTPGQFGHGGRAIATMTAISPTTRAILNAEGLSAQQMQTIAAEFNLAETTFIRPPKDSAHTAEVRIFTPRSEMPFAGHPNVGTAFVLARAGISYCRPVDGDSVIFEEKAGLVPI